MVLLDLWSALPAHATEEPLYSQMTRAVFRLQMVHVPTCTAGQSQSQERLLQTGTGFFVQDYRGEKPVLWAVTARHVVDDANADLIAKVRLESRDAIRKEWLYLPRSNWFVLDDGIMEGFNPFDVAVMPIEMIDDYGYKAFTLCQVDNCPELDAPKTGHLTNQLGEDPEVPEHVLLFGFPQVGPDLKALEPFTRGGIVAYSSRDARFHIRNKPMVDPNVYVIDAFGWPGNSGGPVINEPSFFSPGIRLLGLLTGSHEPSYDFSLITPVSSILRTINVAKDKGLSPVSGWRKNYELVSRSCETQPTGKEAER